MSVATFAAVIPIVLGILILMRRGPASIGWLLILHGFSVALVLSWEIIPWGAGTRLVLDQIMQGTWVLLYVWLAMIAYLVPSGRAQSPAWRNWIVLGVAGIAAFIIGAAAIPVDGEDVPAVSFLPPTAADVLGVGGLLIVVAFLIGAVVSLALRLRRAKGKERLQLLWIVWGALSLPIGLLLFWINIWVFGDQRWISELVLVLITTALPLTIAGSILTRGLFDIRVVLSRTVTWFALTTGVLALYGGALFAAGRFLGGTTIGGVLAVAVIAVLIHPVASILRRRIDRWVFGYRAVPVEALRLLSTQVETSAAGELSKRITDSVAEALRAEKVWIEAQEDTKGLETGFNITRIPLTHRGETLGNLAVVMPPGRNLTAADRMLLGDLAQYAAALVKAEQLNIELTESRTSIVTAREEERRRLRRDLHDGVGPSLAAVLLQLRAAERRADPDERAALVAEAKNEVRELVAEVRRVVDDLRPPALDELGLVGAIQARAATLESQLNVEVAAPAQVSQLPAAVEVAAYRIAMESIANAIRHSGATRCRVEIEVQENPPRLAISIADNGSGLGDSDSEGVGRQSLRARAAELGGFCVWKNQPVGGVEVHAELPFPEVADSALLASATDQESETAE